MKKTRCKKHVWAFTAQYSHSKGSNYGLETFFKCEKCGATGRQVARTGRSAGRIIKIR
jgi:hypothetical protein